MGCGVYWQQIGELEKALGTMTRFGIEETDPAYQALFAKRGALLAAVGKKFPRSAIQLRLLPGFSPGVIRLWHDVESGFFTDARVRPGAPPVYRAIPDNIAMAILKRELTHEEFEALLIPDIDIDN